VGVHRDELSRYAKARSVFSRLISCGIIHFPINGERVSGVDFELLGGTGDCDGPKHLENDRVVVIIYDPLHYVSSCADNPMTPLEFAVFRRE
jgi:hypothetical protein